MGPKKVVLCLGFTVTDMIYAAFKVGHIIFQKRFTNQGKGETSQAQGLLGRSREEIDNSLSAS